MEPYVSVFNVGDEVKVLGLSHVVVHLSIMSCGLPQVLVRHIERKPKEVFYVMDDDTELSAPRKYSP